MIDKSGGRNVMHNNIMKANDLINDIDLYYKEREKFESSFVSKLNHKQRLMLHPIMLKIISIRNKKSGFKIRTLYDKRGNVKGPIIFAVTHIGKSDIEAISEVIKSHYYLLSGDYENIKGTVEEKFLGINGVVYIREDDKEDRRRSKDKMVDILKSNGNMLYFPEGTWNLSPNLPVLSCPYGIIDVAMRANATIIPIGIEQYGKEFIAAVGSPFYVTSYQYDEKIKAINDLRDALAELKMDIWSEAPASYCMTGNKEEFDNLISLRLSEWTRSPDVFSELVFKPKGIYAEKEVFECYKKIQIRTNNCFLIKSINRYLQSFEDLD